MSATPSIGARLDRLPVSRFHLRRPCLTAPGGAMAPLRAPVAGAIGGGTRQRPPERIGDACNRIEAEPSR